MANKWMTKLAKLEGAVTEKYDPFAHCIETPSPSVNFCFGNTWGLPQGFTLALYGPPKGGKTLLCNMMIGQLHKSDPDAMVVKYNTEMRELGQLTDAQAALWGIDRDRYMAFDVNAPALVFDAIEKDVAAMCQDGMPLKLIVIDSITGIQGRRAMNATSIDVQQIGDHALTIQEGLKRILPIQRKYKIAIVLTCHVRAEMDMLEQKRGNKVKMAASFGVQHHAEYFMMVEPNRNAEGRTDLSGNEFRNENLGDLRKDGGKGEQTGHKIRVCMKDSSLGPKGRVGEFTLDYHNGIQNVHEEVFLLAANRGVLDRPNNTSYVFGDKKWVGKQACLDALRESPELQRQILAELRLRDIAGKFRAMDAAEGNT